MNGDIPMNRTAQHKAEITVTGEARQFEAGGQSVTLVPMSIKRRSYSKVLAPPPGNQSASVKSSFDLPLIRTLGKVYYWQRLLDTGAVANATELGRQLRLEPGWVAEVLRLTRLAPDIVQAILKGRQPRHLNLHAARGRQAEVPVDWQEQRELFGFAK
ncbi:hypothetical protein LH417_07925 [Laribacter hongkongensis]|uniref:hypothetical protein n=1 Tax=Laribacter hongkongensis TaxID=168471 RepID=UPI001EFE93F4|nr:hypothetical protein [Laribacter hongkongensis]MCG9022868.1 hypothetical protein [Laribacter hongkongensis]